MNAFLKKFENNIALERFRDVIPHCEIFMNLFSLTYFCLIVDFMGLPKHDRNHMSVGQNKVSKINCPFANTSNEKTQSVWEFVEII